MFGDERLLLGRKCAGRRRRDRLADLPGERLDQRNQTGEERDQGGRLLPSAWIAARIVASVVMRIPCVKEKTGRSRPRTQGGLAPPTARSLSGFFAPGQWTLAISFAGQMLNWHFRGCMHADLDRFVSDLPDVNLHVFTEANAVGFVIAANQHLGVDPSAGGASERG